MRGITTSPNFPATAGAFDTTFNGPMVFGFDAWVAKLSPDGSSLDYSSFLGGGGFDSGSGIAVDAQGSAYVPGLTVSPDFPTTPGAYDRHPGRRPDEFRQDAFVARLAPNGSALVYSTYLGGSAPDGSLALDVEHNGAVLVSGSTRSPDFPTTPGAYDTTLNGGGTDVFVSRLSPTGTALAYSSFLGGDRPDFGADIDVGPDGAAFVTGGTTSPDYPTTPGAFDPTASFGYEGFVTKLDVG